MRSDRRARPTRRAAGRAVAGWLALAWIGLGCSSTGVEPDPSETVDPLRRVVQIATTACGDASRTTGTGVLIGGGRVLTAAHVVIGADELRLDQRDGGPWFVARPVVIDTVRDLAILVAESDPNPSLAPVELVDVVDDDPLVMAGMFRDVTGDTSATKALSPVSVVRPVVMTVDEVRSSRRVTRSGYEFVARIVGGDSGSGVFDDRGRLVALIFAEPTQRDATAFAVGADEIRAVLSAPEGPYACDPNRSRVTPTFHDSASPETSP